MTVCCVMAKAPVAGEVKTRLCPPLSTTEAARIAEAFLLDTWSSARRAFGDQVVLAYAGERGKFPQALASAPAFPQRGDDLGARIESAIEEALSRSGSPSRAIVIGSDLPSLPAGHLRAASELLATADACLGLSSDGGFYLIGATRWHSGLLAKLPWSSPITAEATEARLAEHGYAVAMAPPFDDIDEAADLEKLDARLLGEPAFAPNTAATLANLKWR